MSVNFSYAVTRALVGTFGMAVCAGLCISGAALASPAQDGNPRVAYSSASAASTPVTA